MDRSSLVPPHHHSIPAYRPPPIPAHILGKFGEDGLVRLENNETPFGPSNRAVEELHKGIRFAHRYPESSLSLLRDTLSGFLEVDSAWLHFGSGIEEILTHISRAFLSEGDEVVLASGTFPLYTNYNKIQQARECVVELRDYHYDLKAMREKIGEQTKLVYLCNPNNPTGTGISRDEFEEFIEDLPKDLILVLDEAYFEFTDQQRLPDGMRYFSKVPNLIVLRTLSKAYGLARLRIGYSVQHPDLSQHLLRMTPLYSVNGLAQAAASAAIQDQDYLKDCVRKILEQRDFLAGELESRQVSFCPSEANFLCFFTQLDARKLALGLMEEGVLVCPLNAFGLSQGIRLTVGTEQENQRFLEALDRVRLQNF